MTETKNKVDGHLVISTELYRYALAHAQKEHPALRQLRDETSRHPEARMQTAPDEVQLMGLFIKLMGAKKAIEVGVFTGYSSLGIALALPEDGKLVGCDVNEEYTDIAKKYWKMAGVENKVDLRIAPAVDTLDQLLKEGQENQYDFAYIDADKVNYGNYFERLIKLVRIGGLIAVDNVLWHGNVLNPEKEKDADTVAIKELNEKLKTDERVEAFMLPIADGVTLARRIK